MRDRETGRPSGSGFITFVTQSDADAAINALNGQGFLDQRLEVTLANTLPTGEGGGGGHSV